MQHEVNGAFALLRGYLSMAEAGETTIDPQTAKKLIARLDRLYKLNKQFVNLFKSALRLIEKMKKESEET